MDIAFQQEVLDASYAGRDCTLHLFYGDPLNGGVELDDATSPGYAPATVLSTDWNATDSEGVKSTDPITFADPTDAWQTATHWALHDGGVECDTGELLEPLEITEAGDGPRVVVSVFHDESVEPAF